MKKIISIFLCFLMLLNTFSSALYACTCAEMRDLSQCSHCSMDMGDHSSMKACCCSGNSMNAMPQQEAISHSAEHNSSMFRANSDTQNQIVQSSHSCCADMSNMEATAIKQQNNERNTAKQNDAKQAAKNANKEVLNSSASICCKCSCGHSRHAEYSFTQEHNLRQLLTISSLVFILSPHIYKLCFSQENGERAYRYLYPPPLLQASSRIFIQSFLF